MLIWENKMREEVNFFGIPLTFNFFLYNIGLIADYWSTCPMWLIWLLSLGQIMAVLSAEAGCENAREHPSMPRAGVCMSRASRQCRCLHKAINYCCNYLSSWILKMSCEKDDYTFCRALPCVIKWSKPLLNMALQKSVLQLRLSPWPAASNTYLHTSLSLWRHSVDISINTAN